MAESSGQGRISQFLPIAEGARVTRLELFFDLVFVFAFLNVTKLMAADPTGRGLTRGLLVLALLWWCWCSFAWTGNALRVDQGVMPVALFAAAAAILVVAVTLPEAFGDRADGIVGPLAFPVCYLLVRGLNLTSIWYASGNKPEIRRILARVALPLPFAVALLTLAAVTPWVFGTEHKTAIRIVLWTLAIALEYGAAAAADTKGWRIVSAGHWADRHALILIVALGESIISIGGSGESLGSTIGWPTIVAVLAGIAVAASLWWYHFDFIALAAELALYDAEGQQRFLLARTAYTYLHLPMIAGVILFALGVEQVLHHFDDTPGRQPIHGIDQAALYGGVILYLVGHLGFQLRMLGTVLWTRVGAVVLLTVLVPVGLQLPALGSLVLLAVICVGLVLLENRVLADSRRSVRDAALQEQRAHEQRETAWRRRHR